MGKTCRRTFTAAELFTDRHMRQPRHVLFAALNFMGVVGMHGQGYFDCYGVLNGPNHIHTPCVTEEGAAGTWSANCACIANADAYDCNGAFNGNAFPGTFCQWTNDSIAFRQGIWSTNCTCDLDSVFFVKDCQSIAAGHAWPGTPCVIPGTTDVGVWSPQCACVAAPPAECRADLWVVQAQRADSLAVPYVLWLWDLSRSSSRRRSYQWDFGDGTSSQERYPTHTYKDSGPYELCLSVTDEKGCISKRCRSISVDNDGYFNGLVAVMDHGIGFTVTTLCMLGVRLEETRVFDGLLMNSSPESEQLELELMGRSNATVVFSLVSADGRALVSERRRLTKGRNEWQMPIGQLPTGTYLLTITDGPKMVARRLVAIR
jgi:hypothetical protein